MSPNIASLIRIRCFDWLARQETTGRLRLVEGQVKTWRADLAFTLGSGSAGMAYRMLGHGERHSGRWNGYPFGRSGSDVPASRQRAGSIRGQ